MVDSASSQDEDDSNIVDEMIDEWASIAEDIEAGEYEGAYEPTPAETDQ